MAQLRLVFEQPLKGLRFRPRLWVLLPVTAKHIQDGTVDVRTPGDYLFRGMWYGDKVDDVNSYGKVISPQAYKSIPMGHASGRPSKFLKKKLD